MQKPEPEQRVTMTSNDKCQCLECVAERALRPAVEAHYRKVVSDLALDKEETRSFSSTGGQKGVKLARFDLIPVEALTELAKHYGRGAMKYSDHNYRLGYEWSKSYAALQRHANAFWGGEDIDEETGTPHIIAVAWHAFSLFTYMSEHPEFDDRYRQDVRKAPDEKEDK